METFPYLKAFVIKYSVINGSQKQKHNKKINIFALNRFKILFKLKIMIFKSN